MSTHASVIDEDLAAAVRHGNVQLALDLLKQGANPDAFKPEKTPLLYACQHYPELIDPLIEAGASLEPYFQDVGTGRIKGVLCFAIQEETGEAIEVLVRHGLNFAEHSEALFDAVGKVSLHQNIRRVLELGADPNCIVGERRCMPLHMAAFFGHPKNAQALIDGGALLDARHLAYITAAGVKGPAQDGATPLRLAGHQGHLKVMKTLLEAGASVDEGMLNRAYWGVNKSIPEVADEVVRLVSSYAIRRSIQDAMSSDVSSSDDVGRLSSADPTPL